MTLLLSKSDTSNSPCPPPGNSRSFALLRRAQGNARHVERLAAGGRPDCMTSAYGCIVAVPGHPQRPCVDSALCVGLTTCVDDAFCLHARPIYYAHCNFCVKLRFGARRTHHHIAGPQRGKAIGKRSRLNSDSFAPDNVHRSRFGRCLVGSRSVSLGKAALNAAPGTLSACILLDRMPIAHTVRRQSADRRLIGTPRALQQWMRNCIRVIGHLRWCHGKLARATG